MSYYPEKEDEKNISLPASYLGRKITDLSFHQRTNDSYFNASAMCSERDLSLRKYLNRPETIWLMLWLEASLGNQPTEIKTKDWISCQMTLNSISARFSNLIDYSPASNQLSSGCWLHPAMLQHFSHWITSQKPSLAINQKKKRWKQLPLL